MLANSNTPFRLLTFTAVKVSPPNGVRFIPAICAGACPAYHAGYLQVGGVWTLLGAGNTRSQPVPAVQAGGKRSKMPHAAKRQSHTSGSLPRERSEMGCIIPVIFGDALLGRTYIIENEYKCLGCK